MLWRTPTSAAGMPGAFSCPPPSGDRILPGDCGRLRIEDSTTIGAALPEPARHPVRTAPDVSITERTVTVHLLAGAWKTWESSCRLDRFGRDLLQPIPFVRSAENIPTPDAETLLGRGDSSLAETFIRRPPRGQRLNLPRVSAVVRAKSRVK